MFGQLSRTLRLDAVYSGLEQVIAVLDETRLAAHVFDSRWNLVHATPAQAANVVSEPAIGMSVLSREFAGAVTGGGTLDADALWGYGRQLLPFILHAYGGDRAAVKAVADPQIHDAIDAVSPRPLPPIWTATMTVRPRGGQPVPMRGVTFAVAGGSVELWLPNLGGDLLALLTLTDNEHLERMGRVARSQRRPTAILFADLEASTPLARRLSTEAYFRLMRRVMRAVDDLVVRHGGLVGRHVGDGLTAFYPAELCGGESQAALAALRTARDLAPAVVAAAASVPNAGDVRINAGVHWGATVRLGGVVTAARFEVTALGEEVNEAARIEACATGGRVLASKAVLERLDDDTLAALGVEPDVSYEPLAEVVGAPDKARRDAPTLAVRPV
jgi:class 3 adenylate cyclase